MIRIITAVVATVAIASLAAVGPSFAQSCKENAAKQKLAGAALNSFMNKCETRSAGSMRHQGGRAKARRRGQEQLHQEMRHRSGRRLTS